MRRQLAWTLLLLLASVALVGAQETTSGSITGEVVDTTGSPVPGATVKLTSDQGTKTFVTDGQGRFFAPYLTPGVYSVRVELTGFSPVEQKDINVRLGQRVSLTGLTLKVGGLEEVVEVVGSSPVVDITSTTAGGTLDSEQLKHLPVGRNFTQTLYLVPGVSDSSGVGNANPSIGGASGLENSYVVDGVNITNQGFGGVGVYSIIFGSLGTGVTTDFIKETQVKTAGFEAEYGQSTGGVVNVITKSGSNDFRGSLFGYFQPKGLEADRRTVQTPNGTVNDMGAQNADFGITLGGPIMKDKLFFFGAFNPQYQTLTRIAPDGFPLKSLGEVDRKRRILSYAGKVTWQAGANHRFDFTAFGDPSHGDVGPQRTTSLKSVVQSKFSELDFYGGHNQAVRYDGIITNNWLVEAAAAHAYSNFRELPSTDEHEVSDRTVTPFREIGGIGFYDTGTKGTNLQLSLKSTNIFNAGGNHQLRYGVQWEDIDYTRGFNRSGPPFTFPNGQQSTTGAQVRIQADPVFGRIYRVVRANYGPDIVTNQKYLNWFAQDTWSMGRLTFRPGIRWERQQLNGGQPTLPDGTGLCFEGETVVGGTANGLGPDGVLGTGDDGTNGGLTPKACQYTWTNNWSPRLGATFDIMGDGKSKLYASFGRFFVKIPNDLAARALAADAGISRADYFDQALTRPVPQGVTALGTTNHFVLAGTVGAIFANNSKSTYSDEFVGGFEFEAAKSLNLGIRYIHRNTSTVLEDYAQASPVMYELGFPGLAEVVYLIDNISPSLTTLDPTGVPGFENVKRPFFEDPVHKYDSIELTANKTFANNWSIFASYRWARLKGNFEGFYRSDNGQSDPSITSLFDFPTNDPSYTEIGVPEFGFSGDIRYQGNTLGQGQLPNDRPHQLKLYATKSWSNLNFGLGFNAGSGRRLTGLAANAIYNNSGEIPLTLRGGGVQTVDGFLESTDKEVLVDLHADYAIKVGTGSRRVILLADVFNLTNDTDPTWYDVCSESNFLAANPNFGQPLFGCAANTNAFQPPRSIRFGARFEW
jgi:carboxypeptidase family protein